MVNINENPYYKTTFESLIGKIALGSDGKSLVGLGKRPQSSEIGDYEDAIMVETAIRSEMDCIVTRNMKDYAKSLVKVCEPSALIKLLEEE